MKIKHTFGFCDVTSFHTNVFGGMLDDEIVSILSDCRLHWAFEPLELTVVAKPTRFRKVDLAHNCSSKLRMCDLLKASGIKPSKRNRHTLRRLRDIAKRDDENRRFEFDLMPLCGYDVSFDSGTASPYYHEVRAQRFIGGDAPCFNPFR